MFWCRELGNVFRVGRPIWLLSSIGRIRSRCISQPVRRHVEINKGFFVYFNLVALVHIANERRVNFDDGGPFLLGRLFFGTLGFLVVEPYFVCKS